MDENAKKSILQMCNGAFQERTDYEMNRLIDNILDPNTDPVAKRKVQITLELKPDAERTTVAVSCSVKSSLAPTYPVATMLYIAANDTVIEMTPQIPGQVNFEGSEQEAPAQLRLLG